MKKDKFYNIVFPLWLLFIFPPLILIILPTNFLIDSLIFLLTLKILKISNVFELYKKVIIKIWIIGLIADGIGTLILLLTKFLGTNSYIYDNFTVPLATNPFTNPIAIIYCTFAVLISMIFIYFLNVKISFIKTDLSDMHKKIISIVLAILTAPYLFYLPTDIFVKNENKINAYKLEEYRDTSITNQSNISSIINDIDIEKNIKGYEIQSNDEGNELVVDYKDNADLDIYKKLEQGASIIFNLINDIDVVTYVVNDKEYIFDYNYINTIFDNNIKEKNVSNIIERYISANFTNQDAVYLGNIDGEYDLFDESTLCSDELAAFYEDQENKYLLSCSQIDFIYIINSNNQKYILKDAVNQNIITIEELLKTNLNVYKEKK